MNKCLFIPDNTRVSEWIDPIQVQLNLLVLYTKAQTGALLWGVWMRRLLTGAWVTTVNLSLTWWLLITGILAAPHQEPPPMSPLPTNSHDLCSLEDGSFKPCNFQDFPEPCKLYLLYVCFFYFPSLERLPSSKKECFNLEKRSI